MFCKLSLLALVAPMVSALTLNIPSKPTSGGQITITWALTADDPETFSFELTNEAFNNAFAIANNVNPTAQSLTLTLPIVPVGDGYTLQAVDVGDINKIFASTGDFSIGATPTPLSTTVSVSSTNLSSLRASSTSSGVTSKSSGASSTSGSSSGSSTASTPTSLVVTSSTTPASGSQTSSSSAPSGTAAFSGALSSRFGSSQAGIAAALLSVVAGAVMIAL